MVLIHDPLVKRDQFLSITLNRHLFCVDQQCVTAVSLARYFSSWLDYLFDYLRYCVRVL